MHPPVCGTIKEKALAGTTDSREERSILTLTLHAGVRRESSEESEVLTEVLAPTLEVLISDARCTLPPSHGGDGRAWRGPAEA